MNKTEKVLSLEANMQILVLWTQRQITFNLSKQIDEIWNRTKEKKMNVEKWWTQAQDKTKCWTEIQSNQCWIVFFLLYSQIENADERTEKRNENQFLPIHYDLTTNKLIDFVQFLLLQ